jgi:uncharacterized damage-inducible protein DinB
MSEIARVIDQMKRAWDGDAWHGPPLRQLLSDVSAATANAHPSAGAHSIAEIVLHLAYWKDAGRRRLQGETVNPTDADQWPPPRDESDAAWKEALSLLVVGHKELMSFVTYLPDDLLNAPIAGKDYTVYVQLHGLIQHDLYHAGQIALLKKAAAGK